MIVVCTDREAQRAHAPEYEFWREGLTPYPESVPRYEAIRAALEGVAWTTLTDPEPHADETLLTVHSADYLDFLRHSYAAWAAAGHEADMVSNTFAVQHGRPPKDPAGAQGYYGFDTTPLTAGTWTATRGGADAALTAADRLLLGADSVYALVRPPGHHAGPSRFGGYCYLNHAALAARRLSAHGTVALLDIDYHHGNGTQDVFWEDGEVLFLSLHADPEFEYPRFWGFADETGAGAGAGLTCNIPLPTGLDDDGYLRALRLAVERIRDFAPRWLVISAGLDTYANDPLGTFRLTPRGLTGVGAALAALQLPTLVVQEGGYDVAALGDLALHFLEPFA